MSGLNQRFTKPPAGKTAREFESHILRKTISPTHKCWVILFCSRRQSITHALYCGCMHDWKKISARLIFVAAIWALANIGYYFIFSGSDAASYNTSPIGIFLYFSGWAVVAILYFEYLYGRRFPLGKRLWWYATLSIGAFFVVWGILYIYSFLPTLTGPVFAPYSDILLATPWYFLPKAAEILLQQILILILIQALVDGLKSFKKVVIAYAVLFVSIHIAYVFVSGMPTPYGVIITIGALLSSFVFPFLILRARAGFVYSYTIHLLFYILVATLLHTWPPPGYYIS